MKTCEVGTPRTDFNALAGVQGFPVLDAAQIHTRSATGKTCQVPSACG